MRILTLLLLLCFTINYNILGDSEMIIVPVIPQPQSVSMIDGEFRMPNGISISINDDKLRIPANEIIESLSDRTVAHLLETEDGTIRLELRDDLKTPQIPPDRIDEAYLLTIKPDGILIEAESAKGIFYGVMSLIQLIDNSNDNSVNCMKIVDYPQMKMRGISDDISRGQVSTIDNFKRIIKFISRYKMNTYMPYMEDMIQFKSYPSIGKDRGALSHDEIREIIEYADKHYVEVIPIFQTLGHYENILAQKEYLKFAEFPGAASLNVSEKSTYDFLETLLKEVFDLFPSRYFHMGADESYDVGLGASKHLVEQSSIAEVHADHYRKVYDICKSNGKDVMMYSDIILRHPEILELIPKDIIMIDWHYGLSFEYASAGVFQRAGFEYCVSPAVWNFVTAFPINYIAMPNIEYITQSGINNNAIGMINSNWGDYGAETIKELILYGYAWSANCAWNLNESNLTDFNNIFFRDFFGIEDARLTEIYNTLSDQLNLVTWHDVWRHPALDTREPAWWEGKYSIVAKSYSLKNASIKIRNYIAGLKNKVTANQDHLNIILSVCDLYDFYAYKLETHYYLRQKLRLNQINAELVKDGTDKSKLESEKEKITNTLSRIDLTLMLDNSLKALQNLKSNYRKIWLSYYKEANLKLIEDKFDRLITYFEEIKFELADDSLTEPLIASKWIYCKNGEQDYHSKLLFKKQIDFSGKIIKANVHLLGDTYAKLYINGNFVDEVYVRRSLSLFTESARIKYLDISGYLENGGNLIEVKVENFNRNPSAGFNLIAEIETDEGTINILSDESWFTKPADSSTDWEQAVSKPYAFEIVAPNFKTGRPGWIER